MQLLAQLVLSAVLLAFCGWGLYLVWTRGVNVEGIIPFLRNEVEERVSVPLLRESDAVYRGGEVVGRVSGVKVDEKAKTVYFDELSSPLNFFGAGPNGERPDQSIVFRQYRLHIAHVETMVGVGPFVYKEVTCNID
jgi:hypothetical protein